MLQHSKRQVRYYKSQLYKTFVISDVCNPVCVLFLLKLRWPKTKSIYDTMKSLFKRKKFSTPVYARGQVSHGFLKSEKKNRVAQSLSFVFGFCRYYTDNFQGEHHPRTSIRRD